jgi:hypothetical protein
VICRKNDLRLLSVDGFRRSGTTVRDLATRETGLKILNGGGRGSEGMPRRLCFGGVVVDWLWEEGRFGTRDS